MNFDTHIVRLSTSQHSDLLHDLGVVVTEFDEVVAGYRCTPVSREDEH